jgi:hypothetical protein
MKRNLKCLAVAAASVVTALGVHDALAGNLDDTAIANGAVPPVKVWNLMLEIGHFATWAGPEEDWCLLIDDVTFTVDLNPELSEDRHLLFPYDTLWGPGDQATYSVVGPSNDNAKVHFSPAGLFLARWARARGTLFRGFLGCGSVPVLDPGSTFHSFDSISHTLYGQYVGRERDWGDFEGTTATLSLGLAGFNTSESRHYQTPELVLEDEIISFFGMQTPPGAVNPPGITNHTRAFALMRGRLLTDPNTFPSRAAGPFTIAQ